jgi:copper(I)-binding protein
MKSSMTRFAIALSLLMTAPTALATEGSLMVQDPWVREAPPLSKVLAAYLVMENKGEQNRTLNGASSPTFERVEMHKTEVRDGVANMLRHHTVEIPSGGSLAFKSGGYHLMLIGPLKPLHVGDRVELSLSFTNGELIKVNADVRKVMEGRGSIGNMKEMKSN